MGRKELLALLEEERQLILSRRREEGDPESGPFPAEYLAWYFEISKDWAIVHLRELAELPPGHLLDIGAFCGLLSGTAYRMGWRVTAVDNINIPSFSSLRIPERHIECSVVNACVDPLPLESGSVDAILLSEVLEHLVYSPLPLFREIHRVLRPGGVLLLSTPNPGALSRLVKLARGRNPLEPTLETILAEDSTYTYKGLTFFSNNRESKLWTFEEVRELLRRAGLEAERHGYYGNTVPRADDSALKRAKKNAVRLLTPLLSRTPVGGGGLFVLGKKPLAAE